MTDAASSTNPKPADWPAPGPAVPTAQVPPAHSSNAAGTASIVIGVLGSIVGAITFGVTWLAVNITLNTCRYAGPDGNVDVAQARAWLALATAAWVAMPIVAALVGRRSSRDITGWFVFAGIYAAIGIWSIVKLGPWELCM